MLRYEIFYENLRLLQGCIEILLLKVTTLCESEQIRSLILSVCLLWGSRLYRFYDLRCRRIERDVSAGRWLYLALACVEKSSSPDGYLLAGAVPHGISSVWLDLHHSFL